MIYIILLGYFVVMFTLLMIKPIAAIIFIALSSIVVKAFLPQIKGHIGEKRVHKRLLSLGETYHVFHDVYLKKEDGTTTQLDHIVVNRTGIFVIETKNYTGWIFGNERQRNWTQMIYKNKQTFYNPVLQNRTHVKALKRLLQLENHVHSIIVFSNSATLKFKEPFTTASVINTTQLKKTILNYRDVVFSNGEVTAFKEKLTDVISTINENKREIKRQHIKQVKEAANITPRKKTTPRKNTSKLLDTKVKKNGEIVENSTVEDGVVATVEAEPLSNQSLEQSKTEIKLCPNCRNKLIEKRGKYGKFYGCAGYPKCRYTEKIVSERINQ